MSNHAIQVKNIRKYFSYTSHKSNSLKRAITQVFKPKDKSVNSFFALDGISFNVEKGDFFGILGRNGSGKSTLLKIISEIYQPNSGSVKHEGKLVSFIELGVGFKSELTGRENVYLNASLLGFSRSEIDDMYDKIVTFAELEDFMEQQLKNYSSGMKVRLAFSVAIRAEADILILDEVLAVGDAAFKRKCYDYFQKLKDEHKTIILVSHSMGLIRQYCNRAILIENGKVAFEGSGEDAADTYDAMFADTRGRGGQTGKRWGSGEIQFTDVSVEVTREKLTVSLDITAQVDMKAVMADVKIRDSKNLVAATPAYLKDEHKFDIKSGKTKHVKYIFDNLFGGNPYRVNVQLRSADGKQVYDLWQGAAEFTNEDRPKVPTVYPLEIL